MLVLTGKPISTQNAYRSVCRGKFPTVYITPQAKALKEDYIIQAKQQWKKKPLEDDLSLTIRHYHPTKRKVDIDNFHKFALDSLSGILYVDDCQIVELITQKFIDKENPRIEVIVN